MHCPYHGKRLLKIVDCATYLDAFIADCSAGVPFLWRPGYQWRCCWDKEGRPGAAIRVPQGHTTLAKAGIADGDVLWLRYKSTSV